MDLRTLHMDLTVEPFGEDSAWLLDNGVKVALIQRLSFVEEVNRREFVVTPLEIRSGAGQWHDKRLSAARISLTGHQVLAEGE